MWVSAGKVVFDFYNNDSLKKKRHAMDTLIADLKREYNVSALEVEDFDDLERCVIGLALAAGTEQGARSAMKKVLEYIDTHSVARVMVEDTDVFGYD